MLCKHLNFQVYNVHSRLLHLAEIIYKPSHSNHCRSNHCRNNLYRSNHCRNILHRNTPRCKNFYYMKHFRLEPMWIVLMQALSRLQAEPKAKMYA